jgi:hypothetical protein
MHGESGNVDQQRVTMSLIGFGMLDIWLSQRFNGLSAMREIVPAAGRACRQHWHIACSDGVRVVGCACCSNIKTISME